MIIVTGGAGFIGSNIINELNKQGLSKILVVDNLSDKYKFYNLSKCQIVDFVDVKAQTIYEHLFPKYDFDVIDKEIHQ